MIQVKPENSKTHEISIEELNAIDIKPLHEEGLYHVLINGRSYNAKCLHVDFANRKITVQIGDHSYTCSIRDEVIQSIKSMGYADRIQENAGDVKAPMPGMVIHVESQEGSTIQKGDKLCILEAMKMENVIKAPIDGIITSCPINVGQAVQKGELLFTITPSP